MAGRGAGGRQGCPGGSGGLWAYGEGGGGGAWDQCRGRASGRNGCKCGGQQSHHASSLGCAASQRQVGQGEQIYHTIDEALGPSRPMALTTATRRHRHALRRRALCQVHAVGDVALGPARGHPFPWVHHPRATGEAAHLLGQEGRRADAGGCAALPLGSPCGAAANWDARFRPRAGLFWLLLTGEVPTKAEVDSLTAELHARSTLPAHVESTIRSFPKGMHPMTQLSSAILALQASRRTERSAFAAVRPYCHGLVRRLTLHTSACRPTPFSRASTPRAPPRRCTGTIPMRT